MHDPRDEQPNDLPTLEYEIKHSTYCANCEAEERHCKCDDRNICDLWQLHFNEFMIEIWNEYYLLECELRTGSLYTYQVNDIDFTLKSEEHVKNDTWICTLSFEGRNIYLTVHNKQ